MNALATTDQEQNIPTREYMMSLFDGQLHERMMTLPPDIECLSQVELEKLRKPNENDYKMREKLWILVENAKKASISHYHARQIFEGVCTQQNFDAVINNPVRLAWLMIRPTDSKKKMKTHLEMLLQKIEAEILPKPITDDNMGHFIKLLEFLTNRVQGPMVQRIEAKHAHMKIPAPASPVGNLLERADELKGKLLEERNVTPEPTDS